MHDATMHGEHTVPPEPKWTRTAYGPAWTINVLHSVDNNTGYVVMSRSRRRRLDQQENT